MNQEIDWGKVMSEFEEDEKLADVVSSQIKEERKMPTTVEDDMKLMKKMEREIKKNKLDALEIKNSGSKK